MKFRHLFIACLLVFLAGCDSKEEKQTKKEVEVTQIPATEAKLTQNLNAPFNLEMIDGEIFTMIKKDNGFDMGDGSHATLFVYWATWCPPCIIEIKPLNNLSKNFGKKLKIISVLVNDPIGDDEIKDFIKKHNIIYSITKDSETLIKSIGGIKGIPFMVLYDSNGNYDRHYFGIIAEEMLQKDIEKLTGDLEVKKDSNETEEENDNNVTKEDKK